MNNIYIRIFYEPGDRISIELPLRRTLVLLEKTSPVDCRLSPKSSLVQVSDTTGDATSTTACFIKNKISLQIKKGCFAAALAGLLIACFFILFL